MVDIKLSNGTEVKELRVFDKGLWIAKDGRIFRSNIWNRFIRPIPTFKDNFKQQQDLIVLSNTGKLESNRMVFNTLIRYSVKGVVK